ncbi:PilZ domain-containing protein [Sphingomonas morindae]|uniref:PilZ domain-containing protein n=1 Tax=Sphingomonas morindae TaxID=1541170 RepID=A0ABY4X7X3_9SPHN|nr:PilZ domain-containing protein [Sphingomonas morindae]USI73047.1 PilZ domain-containing protein [Sphingomonas morindae]
MATAPRTTELRRAPRDIVSFRTPIRGPAGETGRAMVVDLSPFGLMARSASQVAIGEIISIALPALGERPARIIWALAGRIGAEFLSTIEAGDYARLLSAAPHDRPSWNGL